MQRGGQMNTRGCFSRRSHDPCGTFGSLLCSAWVLTPADDAPHARAETAVTLALRVLFLLESQGLKADPLGTVPPPHPP